MEEDRISKVYSGKSIFITGGSGFLGKVLIEKLLRHATDLKVIYLLVRTKKGRHPNERLEDIFNNPIFDPLKETIDTKDLLKKCHIICGDVSQIGLGLSDEDRQLLINETNIIYHCAATIRFDEELKTAVLLNTRGTKFMIELAKECKKLQMFCHVSTAYCHLNEKLLLEKPYPPPADPEKIIKSIEWLDNDVINAMTPKILGSLPNTYAFTKALSEGLVVAAMNDLPAVILRPSIVIPCYTDPIPGWTDNINGPSGLLIAAGKGVIRTMYCNSSGYGDFLPVDIAVNGIFASTWNYIDNKDYARNIYHLTSSAEIKVSWEEVINIGRWIVENKVPLNGIFWYPGGSFTSSRLHHKISALLYHWIPAVLIDCLLYCLRYDPVLCRVHRRIEKGFEVFEYYANNQWDFDNANAIYVRTLINSVEKKKYRIDAENIDIMLYFENCIRAARKFILKESDESIPAARRHMRIMWWVDKICKYLIIGLFIYYFGGFILSLIFPSLFGKTNNNNNTSSLPEERI